MKVSTIPFSHRPKVDALFNGYKQKNSKMLLMSGYSQCRLKKNHFAGMTESMLYRNDIPVFIMHT